MRKKFLAGLTFGLFLLGMVGMAEASPVDGEIFQLADNGHYYSWIDSRVHWDVAKLESENISLVHNSVLLADWHLSTITSQLEQDFLVGTVLGLPNSWQGPIGTDRAWIGLFNIGSAINFEWVTGESASYINWHPGEPNNAADTVATLGRYPDGGWNNEGISNYDNAYLIEHSLPGVPVPIPTSIFLCGSSVIALLPYRIFSRTQDRQIHQTITVS